MNATNPLFSQSSTAKNKNKIKLNLKKGNNEGNDDGRRRHEIVRGDQRKLKHTEHSEIIKK